MSKVKSCFVGWFRIHETQVADHFLFLLSFPFVVVDVWKFKSFTYLIVLLYRNVKYLAQNIWNFAVTIDPVTVKNSQLAIDPATGTIAIPLFIRLNENES